MSNLSPMRRMRIVLGVVLAAATLTVLISRSLEDPDLETAIASAIAADHRLEHPLIEVALEQYPRQGPDTIITYGHLPLFQKQLALFGPQVVPIVAAYQKSFTTADALQLTQEAGQALVDRLASWFTLVQRLAPPDPNEEETAPENDAGELDGLSPEDRGLIASLLDRLATWFTPAQSLVAPAAGPLEITGEAADPNEAQAAAQPPVASAADGPEITGEAADPNGEQTAAEKDWLPTWFTPAQQLAGPAADAPEVTEEAPAPDEEQTAAANHAVEMGGLSEEDRGLLALLNMDQQGNVFVGQWLITDDGEARRVPSRVVMLEGPELLAGGLTALERRIFQEREVDWQTYAEAAVDIAAIASGVALLRFARSAGRGMQATRVAAGTPTVRSGALATAKVLGINAIRYGLPIGLAVLMVLYPGVFTHYLWLLAESLGMPGFLGPLIGWGIVIVPLAFLLSWMLLSVRLLGFAGWLLAGAARGCRHLAVRLAVPDPRRL